MGERGGGGEFGAQINKILNTRSNLKETKSRMKVLYRETNKGWDFLNDCTEFEQSVTVSLQLKTYFVFVNLENKLLKDAIQSWRFKRHINRVLGRLRSLVLCG